MSKVLIISYLFPPMGGIGVQRALSLAKYLPENGLEVHVLHAANAAGPVIDRELLRHVPAGVRVHSAFAPEIPFHFRQRVWRLLRDWKSLRRRRADEPSGVPAGGAPSLAARIVRRILCPEPEVLWFPFAYRAARRIVERHAIDVVLVTVPPFSAFLVGNALKRRYPKLKLVDDFRDEWIELYLSTNEFQGGAATRRRALRIEADTVRSADLVVAVTESTLATIRRRYPDQPAAKFKVIPNGYDPEVFKELPPRPRSGSRVLLTYTGTVYPDCSPKSFFQALDRLPAPLRGRLEVRFVGRVADSEKAYFEVDRPSVRRIGFVPQAEAVRHMEEADYLLLIRLDDISIPGKLFEYLATGKPILTIARAGSEVDRLVRETGAGPSVDPDDVDGIVAMLAGVLEDAGGGAPAWRPDRDKVRSFERSALAGRYAALIRGLLPASPPA